MFTPAWPFVAKYANHVLFLSYEVGFCKLLCNYTSSLYCWHIIPDYIALVWNERSCLFNSSNCLQDLFANIICVFISRKSFFYLFTPKHFVELTFLIGTLMSIRKTSPILLRILSSDPINILPVTIIWH